MSQVRIIKKYPNRRLYDTEISSYITLEDVRQLIVDREEFTVRDAKSGADLTRSVLMQIIAEHEEHGQPIFTTEPIIVTPSGTMVEQPRHAPRRSGQLSRS